MTKRKKEKRTITFYKVAFGLTPSYRVLIHPEVIRQCIRQQINLREQLPKVLHDQAVPATTKCITHYLRGQEEFDKLGSAVMARKFNMVPCSHQKVKILDPEQTTEEKGGEEGKFPPREDQILSPEACIADILGKLFSLHPFWIQNKENSFMFN